MAMAQPMHHASADIGHLGKTLTTDEVQSQ